MSAPAAERDATGARQFVPGPDRNRDLRDAFSRFATGVAVVTVRGRTGPVGITVNSFSSVSLDPPLVLWAQDTGSRRFEEFANAERFAAHVLSADQRALCNAVSADKRAIRDEASRANAHGVPILDNCLARFECRRVNAVEAGDHLLVIGRVENVAMRDGDALTFFAGSYRRMEIEGDRAA